MVFQPFLTQHLVAKSSHDPLAKLMLTRVLKNFGRRYLNRIGKCVERYPLLQYLEQFKVDCVLDVGANVGQYATSLRSLGYKGRIESFEPLSAAYEKLAKLAENDPLWNTHQMALGSEASKLEINVSENSATSSFLPIADGVDLKNVGLNYTKQECVQVNRLDDVHQEICKDAKNVFLKIDTQGFEGQVLNGGWNAIESFRGLQVEVSLSPIYEGEVLLEEMFSLVKSHGLTPFWLQNGFRDAKSMQLLQVDAFFFRP